MYEGSGSIEVELHHVTISLVISVHEEASLRHTYRDRNRETGEGGKEEGREGRRRRRERRSEGEEGKEGGSDTRGGGERRKEGGGRREGERREKAK